MVNFHQQVGGHTMYDVAYDKTDFGALYVS